MGVEKFNDENENVAPTPGPTTMPLQDFLRLVQADSSHGKTFWYNMGFTRMPNKVPANHHSHIGIDDIEKGSFTYTNKKGNERTLTLDTVKPYFSEERLATDKRTDNALAVHTRLVDGLYVIDCDDDDEDKQKLCATWCAGLPYTKTQGGTHFYALINDVDAHTRQVNVFQQFKGDFIGFTKDGNVGRAIWEVVSREIHMDGYGPEDVIQNMKRDYREFCLKDTRMNPDFITNVKQQDTVDNAVVEPGPEPQPEGEPESQSAAPTDYDTRSRVIPTPSEFKDLIYLISPDIAHSTGSKYEGRPVGWWTLMCCAKGFNSRRINQIFEEWSARMPDGTPCKKYNKESFKSSWAECNSGVYVSIVGYPTLLANVQYFNASGYEDYTNTSLRHLIFSEPSLVTPEFGRKVLCLTLHVTLDGTVKADIMSSGQSDKVKHWFRADPITNYWHMENGDAWVQRSLHKNKDCVEAWYHEYEQLFQGCADKKGQAAYAAKMNKMRTAYEQLTGTSMSTNVTQQVKRLSENLERVMLFDNNTDGSCMFLFPFRDKVVNLMTGLPRNVEKHDLLCISTGYDYPQYLVDDPPRLKKLQKLVKHYIRTLMGDATKKSARDKAECMLKNMGRSLAATNLWEKTCWLTGTGGNGKSDFIKFMSRMFGELGGTLESRVWTSKGNPETNPKLIKIMHKRFVASVELDPDGTLRTDFLKQITGNDVLSGRPLYSNEIVEFEPHSTVWFGINDDDVPDFNGSDPALQRRILRIHFPKNFHSGDTGIENPKETIFSEEFRDAAILLSIDYFKEYCAPYVKKPVCPWLTKEELPKSIWTSTKTLMTTKGKFSDFFEVEMVELTSAQQVMWDDIWTVYRQYVSDQGIDDKIRSGEKSKLLAELGRHCGKPLKTMGNKLVFRGWGLTRNQLKAQTEGLYDSDEAATEESSDDPSEDDSD